LANIHPIEYVRRGLRQEDAKKKHMSFVKKTLPGRSLTHIDINDRVVRAAWAERFAITEGQLHKAARLVGSRITTLTSHLGGPSGS
jgi:Protein of unknown function (DUF3606)